jgi:predicted ATP-grasp superfamily ATP-dependent carboligase
MWRRIYCSNPQTTDSHDPKDRMFMAGKPASALDTQKRNAKGSGDYDVLILDASMKQSLASVRSLGRAGLRVAAGESVAQFDPAVPLPTFRSRYCRGRLVLPDLISDAPAFVAAVTEFVRHHSLRVILPTGDITIGVLRPYRQQLADLGCVLALAAESALDIANDKERTLALATELGIASPKTMRIGCLDDLSAVVAEFCFPFVLKPSVSWTAGAAERLIPVDVVDQDEAREVCQRILDSGAAVLAQQWVPGRREGVTLFIVGDEVAAACGHVAHRTTPPLGGASAVRESIQVPIDTMDASVRLAKAVGLQGVCEVEFRRDAENRPLLMEINARLAGTIENAVQAGVDFPMMIWRLATALEIAPVTTYRSGIRTRWLHGDLRWLYQNWQRSGRPDGVSHARGIRVFVVEFGKSRHYDYFDLHDIKPFLAELRYTMHVFKKFR